MAAAITASIYRLLISVFLLEALKLRTTAKSSFCQEALSPGRTERIPEAEMPYCRAKGWTPVIGEDREENYHEEDVTESRCSRDFGRFRSFASLC